MKTHKKPPLKSKPAAKKKATKKATAHDPQSLALAAIAALRAELKRANQKLDYLLVRAAPLNREEWHPLIEQAAQALENGDGEGN
jgi:hypothetical protein